ncbi:MAG: ribonuclease D [Deltaproteobacteria bacterium]|nr:ribonuclease D [Deltaproteobacteria bacterium]
MDRETPSYSLVKNEGHLERISAELKRERAIGVDLEANSLFRYHERVCLIQISTTRQNIIVDPLALDSLSPIASVFSNPKIRKVFHGADYDIRSLYRDFGIEVHTLFDTYIAAKALGISKTGLAAILKERLGVTVNKNFQKRDWSKRPLSPGMLAYAIEDTCYLLPLSRILEGELRVKGLLRWVEQECERQALVRPAPPDMNPLFTRFKGARKLDPRGLAVLDSILRLRDDTARRKDRPPFKIIGNEQVMEIAKRKPMTKEDLGRIQGVSPRQVKILGPSVLKKVEESLSLPADQLPKFPKKGGRSRAKGSAK